MVEIVYLFFLSGSSDYQIRIERREGKDRRSIPVCDWGGEEIDYDAVDWSQMSWGAFPLRCEDPMHSATIKASYGTTFDEGVKRANLGQVWLVRGSLNE